MIDATRAIFARCCAAEPDILIKELNRLGIDPNTASRPPPPLPLVTPAVSHPCRQLPLPSVAPAVSRP